MSTLQARPFHVSLFSSVFEEFKDLFVHASNESDAATIAMACVLEEEAESEFGSWEVLKVQCTA
jgi:hypothetical protein